MRNYVIALYIRLSVEDFKTESLSIPNQKLILREKAMSLPEWDNSEILEFIDNGHTGTNFERPAVQELLTMVQAGKINCIIVKDLSRFGRNSIETGYFIERVFPLYHTRFISVSDDFDTANFKGDTGGIDIAFKYLISECYSRDMSMKTKSAKYAKMSRGEYQSVISPATKPLYAPTRTGITTAATFMCISSLTACGLRKCRSCPTWTGQPIQRPVASTAVPTLPCATSNPKSWRCATGRGFTKSTS